MQNGFFLSELRSLQRRLMHHLAWKPIMQRAQARGERDRCMRHSRDLFSPMLWAALVTDVNVAGIGRNKHFIRIGEAAGFDPI